MLFSIETARRILSELCLVMCGFNAMAMAMFLLPLFPELSMEEALTISGVAAGAGFIMGTYLTFRSTYNVSSAILRAIFIILMMEFLFAGSICAWASWIAGQRDLCWLAFQINGVVMIGSILTGMYHEATTLELRDGGKPWKAVLSQHIDYENYQVSPDATGTSNKEQVRLGSIIWLVAPVITNIPLLFDFYGGGRNNLIFICAPVMTATLAYLNLKHSGPGLLRLLLLRQLEKEHGRRFINADLEQIQELRRTFFLSRWLMKDYARPIPQEPAKAILNQQPLRKRKRK